MTLKQEYVRALADSKAYTDSEIAALSSFTPNAYSIEASDDLRASDDTEYINASETYVKIAELTVTKKYLSAVIRCKFDMRQQEGHTAYGKIYKNGVAIGTEQSTTSDTYVTKSEDIDFTSLEIGDLIQLYAMGWDVDYDMYYKNFRLYGIDKVYVTDSWS